MDLTVKKKTLRLLSNGIYVVTSRSGDRYAAATVTWLSPASFKPPLIMAALRKDSNLVAYLREIRIAGVHILGCDQQALAQIFFSPTAADAGAINGIPFRDGNTGAPLLQAIPAHLECAVHRIGGNTGDHAVCIIEVVEAECRQEVEPLTIRNSPWEYGG